MPDRIFLKGKSGKAETSKYKENVKEPDRIFLSGKFGLITNSRRKEKWEEFIISQQDQQYYQKRY